MYDRYVYLDNQTVREYIDKCGNKMLGKEYELGAGIFMTRFFEIENKETCVLGIKIQDRYRNYYRDRKAGALSFEEAKVLIEKHKDEDDPFDMAVAPVSGFKGTKNSAWRLQFKRFGHYQQNKTTSGLIDTLSKIKASYSPTSGFLTFLFDGHKGLDLESVHEHLVIHGCPFSKVLFINPAKEDDDEWVIKIGEIWPGYGHNNYDPNLFKKNKDSKIE